MDPQTEEKTNARSSKVKQGEAESIEQIMARFSQFASKFEAVDFDSFAQKLSGLEKSTKRLEKTLESGGIDFKVLSKSIKKMSPKTRRKLHKSIRDAVRADHNVVQRGLDTVEDVTGGWAPAIRDTAAYGLVGFFGGQLLYNGAKAGWALLTGDPAAALEQISS